MPPRRPPERGRESHALSMEQAALNPSFQQLQLAQLRPAAELSARAFDSDPFFRYLLPKDLVRASLLTEVMQALMAPLTPLGGTYAYAPSPALQGVLCVERWEKRATGLGYVNSFARAAVAMVIPLLSSWLRFEDIRRLNCGLRALLDIQELHPSEPHDYVAILTVDPTCQRGGIGRDLLSSFLAESDSRGRPVHLETSRPDNVGYYQRFGFRVVHELTVADAPPLWIMTRPAAQSRP